MNSKPIFSVSIMITERASNYIFIPPKTKNIELHFDVSLLQECAPGYYRSRTGPHLGFCVPCQCNGHADKCDVSTGKCIDCKHDTTGDHCEQCIAGYYGDSTEGTVYDCMICVCPLPYPSNNFATSCEVSPSGKAISCQCKEGYYGPSCDV